MGDSPGQVGDTCVAVPLLYCGATAVMFPLESDAEMCRGQKDGAGADPAL